MQSSEKPESSKASIKQWAEQTVETAAAKHKEILKKSLSEEDRLLLHNMARNLTCHFSKHSEYGQAAVHVITAAASFLYECLAIGYCIRTESHLLKQNINKDTDKLVKAFSAKHSQRSVRLSSMLGKLQDKQLKWEESAETRYQLMQIPKPSSVLT